MDYIERNYQIIEEKMIEQMKSSLAFGRRLIDKELDAGVLNIIVKPIIKAFYDYWSDKDAREGTLEQINITLGCGKMLLNNGATKEKFDEMVEEYFPKYLAGDQASRQCKAKHKNFKKLKEITKETFISQVEETLMLLEVKDDIQTYADLIKKAFKTKEGAYKSLIRILDFTDEGIKIIEKDPSILKVPSFKQLIIKILRKGFNQTRRELIENLDDMFS